MRPKFAEPPVVLPAALAGIDAQLKTQEELLLRISADLHVLTSGPSLPPTTLLGSLSDSHAAPTIQPSISEPGSQEPAGPVVSFADTLEPSEPRASDESTFSSLPNELPLGWSGSASCVTFGDNIQVHGRACGESSAVLSRDGSPSMSTSRLVKEEESFASDARMFAWLPPRLQSVAETAWEKFSKIQEPKRSGVVASIVLSSACQALVAFVIVCNCIFGIVKADIDMEWASTPASVREDASPLINNFELGFVLFFSLECVVKLGLHRLYYFVNHDGPWNCFDFFLVATALLDVLAELLGTESINATFFRTFRLLKIVRVARLFRMIRVLKELRLMMKSMLAACMALFWSVVMLVFMLTIFSLLALQGLSLHVRTQMERVGAEEYLATDEYGLIMRHFGSVATATLTLYQSTTGGESWSVFYDLLFIAHPCYAILFCFYIAWFYFAVANVLTGVIVENIEKIGIKEDEDISFDFRKSRKQRFAKIQKLFSKLDEDGSGTLSWEEFAQHIDTPLVQAYFKEIDVDVREAEVFYQTITSLNETSEIDVHTFLDGCERIRSHASGIDMQSLLCQAKTIRDSQAELGKRQERTERMSAAALALLGQDPAAIVGTDGGGLWPSTAGSAAAPRSCSTAVRAALEEPREPESWPREQSAHGRQHGQPPRVGCSVGLSL